MWPGPAPLARRAGMGIASPTLTSNVLCVFVNSWLVQSCTLPCSWSNVWALGRLGLPRRPALTWGLSGW
jgi:hypothetical protein